MDIDSLDRNINMLSARHQQLEYILEKMYKQKSWNEFEAETLKKEKLKIKDQLTTMHKQRYQLLNDIDWNEH